MEKLAVRSSEGSSAFPLNTTVRNFARPSKKSTLPVGAWPEAPETVAVKVTVSPPVAGLGLETSVVQQRFLVLSEMYFPGWHAMVDGVETPIYRTNYLFRGIAVPAGQHTVMFVYRPMSVLIGAGVSLAALVIIGCLLRRPKPSTS